MNWWRNNYFRFGMTFLLCFQYSLLRETEYSTIIKPLPIVFWLFVVLFSTRRKASNWLIASLSFAFVGDILLDLGDEWLQIGVIPFLGSTALLATAFYLRLKNSVNGASIINKSVSFILIGLPFFLLYKILAPRLEDEADIGAILFVISALLLWTSLNNFLFNMEEKTNSAKSLLGLIGACGIVANYVLYSIDISFYPIPRDVVIQVYYWGQAFVSWSFLKTT